MFQNAGIQADGSAVVRGGEPWQALFHLIADGEPQDVAGRSFVVAFKRENGATAIASVTAVVDGADIVAVVDGETTAAIYAAGRGRALAWQLIETTAEVVTLIEGRALVNEGAAAGSPGGSLVQGGAVSEVALTIETGAVLVTQAGPRGATGDITADAQAALEAIDVAVGAADADAVEAGVARGAAEEARDQAGLYAAQARQSYEGEIIEEPLDPEARYVIVDSSSPPNILMDVTAMAIRHPAIQALEGSQEDAAAAAAAIASDLGPAELVVVDPAGNLLVRMNPSTIVHPHITAIETLAGRGDRSALVARGTGAASGLSIATRMLALFLFGQSNSSGVGDPLALPSAAGFARMFNGGINSRFGFAATDTDATTAAGRTGLAGIHEANNETGSVALILMLAQLLADEDGIDLSTSGLVPFASATGVGGQNIAQLRSNYFFRLEEDVVDARAVADAAGFSFGTAVSVYDGNESNQLATTTIAAFLTPLREMQTAIEARVQAASGLAGPVPMLIAQTNSHLATTSSSYFNANAWVARAQLAAALNTDAVNPNIVMTGPTYQLPHGDAVHLTALGQAIKRAQQAVTIKRLFFDGRKPALLVPVMRVSGGYLRLTFPVEPGCQLVRDAVTVAAQPNMGLRVFNGAGVEQTVTAAIAGPRTIEIKPAAGAPAADWTCDYAFTTNVSGGSLGLGNLRDSAGDRLVARFLGRRLDNWVPLFKIGVTA